MYKYKFYLYVYFNDNLWFGVMTQLNGMKRIHEDAHCKTQPPTFLGRWLIPAVHNRPQ